jgi:hypothetical protein
VSGRALSRRVKLLLALAAVLPVSIGLSAGLAGAAQLRLDWVDNAAGSASFKIERKTGTTGTFAQIATTAAGVTAYVDSTVVPGATYCYRVRASNASGDSSYSNQACGASVAVLAVTVVKAGGGSGTVTSNPAGINCGTDCAGSYAAGTVVTLWATPARGSRFSGWRGGACAGTAPCVMAGNTPATVTATFALANAAPRARPGPATPARPGDGPPRTRPTPKGRW